MKRFVIAMLALLPSLVIAEPTAKAKKELELALTGNYQALRNVAFSMKDGSFGHDKQPIVGCALRKVILIVNQDQADISDYSNEYVDCRALNVQDSQKAWEITLQTLPLIIKSPK